MTSNRDMFYHIAKFDNYPKVSKREAVERRVNYYWTGVPCKHGHIFFRYTATSVCVLCQRVQSNKKFAKRIGVLGNAIHEAERIHDELKLAKELKEIWE